MSFIQQTMKCTKCNYKFNVALGTFGYGMPTKCPECGSRDFKFFSHGWSTDDSQEKTIKRIIYNKLTYLYDRTTWCKPLKSLLEYLRYEVFYPYK